MSFFAKSKVSVIFNFNQQKMLLCNFNFFSNNELKTFRQYWSSTAKIERGLGTERARLGTFRAFGTERARLDTFKGVGTERARLGTFRDFGAERARLGTFRGFGTERARLNTFRGFGTERARLGTFIVRTELKP